MESKYQFNNIATEWLKSKEIQLKPSSISKYSNILNWYLLPTFSDLDIRKITRNDVRSVSQMLLVNDGTRSQGLSTKTVAGIVSVLKNIFDFALMEKELDVVVINNISKSLPGYTKKKVPDNTFYTSKDFSVEGDV